jgi:hypothetical protein
MISRVNYSHEKLHENSVFGSHRSNVHAFVCSGQTSRLQKERQELPDERQQGMQLRQGLQLLVRRVFPSREIDNHHGLHACSAHAKPSGSYLDTFTITTIDRTNSIARHSRSAMISSKLQT